MRRMRRRGRRKELALRRRVALGIVLLVGILFLEFRAAPLIETAVVQQAEQLSVEAVNRIAVEVLDDLELSGGSFVQIVRDETGNVQSMISDAQKINRFKAEMNRRMQEEILQLGKRKVRVAIGTLIGGNFLRERGPKLTFRFRLDSSVSCRLENAFTSAGINQTRHSVNLTVTTTVYTMIPGNSTETELQTEFCVAEEVIIGTVPDLWIGEKS